MVSTSADPPRTFHALLTHPLKPIVRLFYSELPIFDEEADDAFRIVSSLSGEDTSPAQQEAFRKLFTSAPKLLSKENLDSGRLKDILFGISGDQNIQKYGVKKDLFALSFIADAAEILATQKDRVDDRNHLAELGFKAISNITGQQAGTYRALARQLRRAAFELRDMERINRLRAGNANPIPKDRKQLVQYGKVSIIILAGYTEGFQATMYSLIAQQLFKSRVQGTLPYPYLMVVEEAHNFVPGQAIQPPILRSIATTKQIAQEGRKFGVGLILISQRPSRLDETTLSQCNSYIIMRMVNPADQNFVRRVVETLGEDEARMLPDLDVGEAILSGQLINFPVLVRIKEPKSKGEREERDAFEVLENSRKAQQATGKG